MKGWCAAACVVYVRDRTYGGPICKRLYALDSLIWKRPAEAGFSTLVQSVQRRALALQGRDQCVRGFGRRALDRNGARLHLANPFAQVRDRRETHGHNRPVICVQHAEKFQRIDANAYRMLLNQKFWFSHPPHFNDPFDSDMDIRDLVDRIKDRIKDPVGVKQAFDGTLKG